ncbi:MAG: ATP-binding protein [Actinobacteria bacterium]|nr:ATP-binding protein [Actinomycetota bacterium]
MTDDRRFEDLVVLALQGLEPSLRPTGGAGDRQRDAVAGSFRTDDDRLVVTASLQRTWAQKVAADLEGLTRSGDPLPDAVISATNRRTGARKRNELEKEAPGRFGFRLRVFDQRMLALRLLRPELLHVREELLGLSPPTPPVAVEAGVYRTLLASTASHVDRLHGRDRALRSLLAAIDSQRVVTVMGPGGIGKTRLVLAAADELGDRRVLFVDDRSLLAGGTLPAELAGTDRLVLVVDNAHRLTNLRQLVGLLARRSGPVTLVLVARDGFLQRLEDALEGSPFGQLGPDVTITLTPMSNASIAAMVRSAEPSLEYGGAIDVIVSIAGGNPLIALLAHDVAIKGRPLDQMGRDEVLAEHARSLLRTVQMRSEAGDRHEFGELLAVIAALSWLDVEEGTLVEAVAKLVDIPLARLKRMLLDIADSGLLSQQGSRFAITPDLLAGHLLWSSFFAPRRAVALSYRHVWDALAPAASDRLCAALGGLPFAPVPVDDPNAAYVAESLRVLARRDAGSALVRVQSLAPGLPWVAVRVVDDALAHLPEDARARSRALLAASEALKRTPDFSEGWPRQLAVAAALFAEDPDPESVRTVEEHLTTIYERVPVNRGPNDGQTLAGVQQGLADLTLSFWKQRRAEPGTAETVAIAVRQLLTVTFSTSFMSPEDDRRVMLHGYCLPASSWTKQVLMMGARLLAEVLSVLPVREQLKAIRTTDNLRHAAGGFQGPFGVRVDRRMATLASEVVEDIRARLTAAGDDLSIVVRSAIEDVFGSLWPDDSELEEYGELLASRLHGRQESYDPDARERRAVALADRLMLAADGMQVLRKWESWLTETDEAGVRYVLWVIADGLHAAAERDPERMGRWLDELLCRPGPLVSAAAGALALVIDRTSKAHRRATLAVRSPHAEIRALAAAALRLSTIDRCLDLLRILATDDSDTVRNSVVTAVAHGTSLGAAELDVGLLASKPDDIEHLTMLLSCCNRSNPDETLVGLTAAQASEARAVVLAAVRRDRLDGHDFVQAFRLLAKAAPRLPIDCARARLEYLSEIEDTREITWALNIDGLPDEFAAAMRTSATATDVAWVLDEIEATPKHGIAKGAQRDFLKWVDDGRQVTERLARWLASQDERLRYEATVVLDFALGAGAFRARAAALLAIEPPLDIDQILIEARDPKFWSGSRVPRWESRRKEFAQWIKDPNERVAAVGRAGAAFYRRLVEQGDSLTDRWETEAE